MTSRREFLQRSALSAVGLSLAPIGSTEMGVPVARRARPSAFLDLFRPPDAIVAQTAGGDVQLRGAGGDRWTGGQVVVTASEIHDALRVRLSAPSTRVLRLHLRWRGDLSAVRGVLGDAWERGYGDLEWRSFVPERVMPWYFAACDGDGTHGYGVRTGPAAFCFWQVDSAGISLWADVRSGGSAIELGGRALDVCDVVCREGRPGESPFAALHAFCASMCADPRLPSQPVYGSNDWYWAYGNNSAASALADAGRIVDLSPTGANRPFTVIDDGWQPERGRTKSGRGMWDRGNEKFPDLPGLAGRIRRAGARPGIWIRPLLAPDNVPDTWRLPRERGVLDPSVPEVKGKVAEDIRRLNRWGWNLIKHDYTTYDILGLWGFRMGASLTAGGWTFAEGPRRTTAEVLTDLYRTIRTAAGDALVIGCNTVSHLSAGVFDMCRIGDDTSGKDWARVRRMGVNSLAFRAVQHGAFYAADPDCIGVTNDIPWSLNRQWLDLLAHSGTTVFVSLAADALNEERKADLRAALDLAARPRPLGEPLDWQHTVWPTRWRMSGGERTYDWIGPDGVEKVG